MVRHFNWIARIRCHGLSALNQPRLHSSPWIALPRKTHQNRKFNDADCVRKGPLPGEGGMVGKDGWMRMGRLGGEQGWDESVQAARLKKQQQCFWVFLCSWNLLALCLFTEMSRPVALTSNPPRALGKLVLTGSWWSSGQYQRRLSASENVITFQCDVLPSFVTWTNGRALFLVWNVQAQIGNSSLERQNICDLATNLFAGDDSLAGEHEHFSMFLPSGSFGRLSCLRYCLWLTSLFLFVDDQHFVSFTALEQYQTQRWIVRAWNTGLRRNNLNCQFQEAACKQAHLPSGRRSRRWRLFC